MLIIIWTMWGSLVLILLLNLPWLIHMTRNEVRQSGIRVLLRTQNVCLSPGVHLGNEELREIASNVVKKWRVWTPHYLQASERENIDVSRLGSKQFKIVVAWNFMYSLKIRDVEGITVLSVSRMPVFRLIIPLALGASAGFCHNSPSACFTGILGLVITCCTDLGGLGSMLARDLQHAAELRVSEYR
ncbi:MAG: hypothetical protein ABFD83_05060 [Armatimonadota bacterium]